MVPTIQDKVEHVRHGIQVRDHHCHWPGCTKQVPPAMWGCPGHWRLLPKRFRDAVWQTYTIGQELSGRPTAAYLEVAKEIQSWINQRIAALCTTNSSPS